MRVPREVRGLRRGMRLEKRRRAMPVSGRGLLETHRLLSTPSRKAWLGLAEAAALLGLAPARVRALVTSGELPARRESGVWLIKGSDVAACQARLTGRARRSRTRA